MTTLTGMESKNTLVIESVEEVIESAFMWRVARPFSQESEAADQRLMDAVDAMKENFK